jgi:hypothetical protein
MTEFDYKFTDWYKELPDVVRTVVVLFRYAISYGMW